MTHRRAVRVLIAAVLVFAFFVGRNYIQGRTVRARIACERNLLMIEGAKEQFAIEHDGQAPSTLGDLIPAYISNEPDCPSGGTYTLGDMQVTASCNQPGHHMPGESEPASE